MHGLARYHPLQRPSSSSQLSCELLHRNQQVHIHASIARCRWFKIVACIVLELQNAIHFRQ